MDVTAIGFWGDCNERFMTSGFLTQLLQAMPLRTLIGCSKSKRRRRRGPMANASRKWRRAFSPPLSFPSPGVVEGNVTRY